VTVPLTAPELDGLRADLAGALPELAVLERAAPAEPDPHGHPPPPTWEHLATVPCSYWQGAGRTLLDPAEAVVTTHRLAVPHGTDVRPSDRVAAVAGADGEPRMARPMRIDAVLVMASHVELDLAEVSW
jgi:hypothetical protein